MNRSATAAVTGSNRFGMTVGALLDDKRPARKRSYEEVGRSDVKQQIVRELTNMAMETDRNDQEVYLHADYGDPDLPDEIECQLIQKTLLINGTIQTVDFIMCNQCPRLFRTENLLWNHIKGKHNRRNTVRRHVPPPPARKLPSPHKLDYTDRLEPGEIQGQDAIAYAVDSSGLMDTVDHTDNINLIIEPESDISQQDESESSKGGDDSENREPDQVLQRIQEGSRGVQIVSNDPPTKTEPPSSRLKIEPMVALNQREKNNSVYVVGVEKRKPAEEHRKTDRSNLNTSDIYNNYGSWKFTCWNGGCTGQVFTNRKHIENHIKKYHDALAVECDICGQQVTNIRRHREVSHKKFRAYDCTHCGDKFCSRDDLDRHLRNVEKRNRVDPNQVGSDVESSKEDDVATDREEEEIARFVKELESQTFSCSDCGVKTPSRMTYMQHVLSGCIMDQQPRPLKRDRKPRFRREERERCIAPAITKHVIIQHDGRREHIIVEQERELKDAVREQLGHRNERGHSVYNSQGEPSEEDVDGQLADGQRQHEQEEEEQQRAGDEQQHLEHQIQQQEDPSQHTDQHEHHSGGLHGQQVTLEQGDDRVESNGQQHVDRVSNQNGDNVIQDPSQQENQDQDVHHHQYQTDEVMQVVEEDAPDQVPVDEGEVGGGGEVLHLAAAGETEGQYVHIVQDENGETTHLLIDQSGGGGGVDGEGGGGGEQVLQFIQGEDGDNVPVLQVVEGDGGEHVIHVTEEQLAQLQAHAHNDLLQ